MTGPILFFSNCCCGNLPKPSPKAKECNLGDKMMLCAAVVDVLILITCLAVGILGLFSVNGMSTAAALAFIGVGSGIALLWTATLLQILLDKENEIGKIIKTQ